MSIEIKVTTNNFDKIKDEFERRMPIILEAVGQEMEGNAQSEITKLVYESPPSETYVRTGLLRNSLTHAVSGHPAAKTHYSSDDGSISGSYSGSAPATSQPSVIAGTNVEYAPYVEFGSAPSKRGPRPYLKNSVTKSEYQEKYKEIFIRGLKGL